MDLDDSEHAPSQARRAVRAALVSWRLPALVEAVTLSVSELVTNARRHGRPPVWVVLRRGEAGVDLDVHDGDHRVVATPPSDVPEESESGRGLRIVQALAGDVSYQQVPGDGKIVRATFDVPAPNPEPAAEPEP